MYEVPPPQAQQIALLDAHTDSVFAPGGQKSIDKVIERLKTQAAQSSLDAKRDSVIKPRRRRNPSEARKWQWPCRFSYRYLAGLRHAVILALPLFIGLYAAGVGAEQATVLSMRL